MRGRAQAGTDPFKALRAESCTPKPHRYHDPNWRAILALKKLEGKLTIDHFQLVSRLGSGDVGTVNLMVLKGSNLKFAVKSLNKQEMLDRNKTNRIRTEDTILSTVDHPFLATLYTCFQSDKHLYFVMEARPHAPAPRVPPRRAPLPSHAVTLGAAPLTSRPSLRPSHRRAALRRRRALRPPLAAAQQAVPGEARQVLRRGGAPPASRPCAPTPCAPSLSPLRPSQLAPASAPPAAHLPTHPPSRSQVLLALQYLHLMGYIYRDLKPENVLVHGSGHVVLTDFDLSYCASSRPHMLPPSKTTKNAGPILVAEPFALTNSFVGTEEYLSPEVINATGHNSAVDWWELGIFLYELLYGFTPFRGAHREQTFENILHRNLAFPETPTISPMCRDVLVGLLQRNPARRLGTQGGAEEIKAHPFFDSIQWSLLRWETPPFVPNAPPQQPQSPAAKDAGGAAAAASGAGSSGTPSAAVPKGGVFAME